MTRRKVRNRVKKKIKPRRSPLVRQFGFAHPICVVANTPAYLYKHLRSRQEVFDVAKSHTSAELMRLLDRLSRRPKGDMSPAPVYVYLAALSFKPSKEIKGFLASYQPEGVKWMPEMRGLVLASAKMSPSTTLSYAQAAPDAGSDYEATFQNFEKVVK
jgi:hypothetical protein